jgi:AraC-like DNA-binding protein
MPEINGIDLCLKIKADKRTSHIPVILLTALTGEEQQLKGLETGASDYMTKPFNFEILQSKIRNILSHQEYMRKTYRKQVEATPTEIHIDSPDELFIKKVLSLIDNNISNPNFSVEELSSEVCVSRYTLYKKILAMTGKTPNELVRYMRLKRATSRAKSILLKHSRLNSVPYLPDILKISRKRFCPSKIILVTGFSGKYHIWLRTTFTGDLLFIKHIASAFIGFVIVKYLHFN